MSSPSPQRAIGRIEKPEISLGFMPLSDSAPLVVAHELGFFKRHGLKVELSRETSWANIRDKVALGLLDGAQMLAPMTLASRIGVDPLPKPLITALSLALNGKAITVSEALFRRLRDYAPEGLGDALAAAQALRRLIDAERDRPPLTFAVVYPFSMHNYILRYWLAAGGVDPDRDVRLVVIPPPQMVSQLRRGAVDGYCVGEPWNSAAVHEGLGRVLVTDHAIWNHGPEKVLGVTEDWADQHPHTHDALICALLEAMRWLDQPQHRGEVAELIAGKRYLDSPVEVVRMSMLGTYQFARNEFPRSQPEFHIFHRYQANFPWRSHALWIATQMQRWHQLPSGINLTALTEATYRSDLYLLAASRMGLAAPGTDYKSEGLHSKPWQNDQGLTMGSDRFVDRNLFDPIRVIAGRDSEAAS
ncbi:MAG: ABC transporter substrate-binding protein [Gammaproteobacteria bacterium]|nr:ABC transporter substrate-binding protein [Gammaproteobacteria bacterium]MCP5135938.1 ABC transporter substrate-binding protein [Gammaproteobacteria bacterium]